jgi:large repetitive protein
LGNGVIAFPFGAALAATGGTTPYKWSATGLPDGVTLDSGTGAISGTPTKSGTFPVSVQVTDQDNQNASRSFSVEIAAQVSITTATVGPMVVGTPVSTPLAAAGGKAPYSWSVQSGSLPAGISISAEGVLSGTPTATGDSNFTLQVRDANNTAASKSFAVRVVTPVVLTTQTIPAAPFGAAYSTSFTATGGTPPYSWSIVSGSLPAGLTLSSTGTLSGSTTASGTSNFTVQVADAGATPQTVQRAFSLQTQLPDVSGLNVTVPQNPQPGQQSNIALAIGSPYPVEVTGTLALTFAPNAANNSDDPAIQFSTGGRTVEFTIPAGQTQAVFRVPNLGIQTGTTAGTITLATSLQAAGTPVNCNCQLSQTIVIPRTAPTLSAVRATRTGTGFNIVVTGFSTTREVTQGTFRFAGTTNLQTTELTVALTSTFNTYFQSTAASQFGGQFTLTIPFTIQGDTATVNSVTVVLTNAVGSSQPVTATF